MNNIDRYIITIENTTPLRIATGNDLDELYVIDDKYVIPGTTIAGIFVDFVDNNKDQIIKKYKIKNIDKIIKLITGKEQNEDKTNKENNRITSCLKFYNAVSTLECGNAKKLSRDHIKVNSKYGCSKHRSLQQESMVQRHNRFELVIEVDSNSLIHDNENKVVDVLEEIQEIIKIFLVGINKGLVRFGARTSYGYGKFIVKTAFFKRFDLETENDFISYLNTDNIYSTQRINKLKKLDIKKLANENEFINRTIEFSLKCFCKYGFCVKGETETYFKEFYNDGKSVVIIPSSTIKGLIRNRCTMIANKFMKDNHKDVIDNLFGNENNGLKEIRGTRGKLIFDDVVINKPDTMTLKEFLNKSTFNQTNIKIDRFTGGVFEGGIRKSEVLTIPEDMNIEIKISTRASKIDKNEKEQILTNEEIALLIYSLRDIAIGEVNIGGNSSIGYGVFEGKDLIIKNFGNTDGSMKSNDLIIDFVNEKIQGNGYESILTCLGGDKNER